MVKTHAERFMESLLSTMEPVHQGREAYSADCSISEVGYSLADALDLIEASADARRIFPTLAAPGQTFAVLIEPGGVTLDYLVRD